jgi:hypothetical protein
MSRENTGLADKIRDSGKARVSPCGDIAGEELTPKFCKDSHFTNLCGSNHCKQGLSRENSAFPGKAGGIVGSIADEGPRIAKSAILALYDLTAG